MIRTLWAFFVGIIATIVCAGTVIIAGLLRIPDRQGGVYDTCQRLWARALIWASGVRVVLHDAHHLGSRRAADHGDLSGRSRRRGAAR